MMIELKLKNYRCFPASRPVRLRMQNGFTAFLGINNSGKSSLLKFFFEFRTLFSWLSKPAGPLAGILERRATENYFTDAAVKRWQGPRFGALGPHDALPAGWSKASNWRMASEMTLADLNATDLGKFLAGL